MKIKMLFFSLVLLAMGGSLFAQEGTPVRNLFGSGVPNANLAHIVGTTYVDQSTNPGTIYTCTAVTLTNTLSQCTWTAGGSSSSTSNPAPKMGFYFTGDCSTVVNAYCQNTFSDTQQFNDGSWTNASNVLTFASSHFGAGQALVNPVGMSVMGFQTCADDVTFAHATGGEIAPNAAMPTVTGFTANTLTISATPANTQAMHATFPKGGCVVIGHIDDAAAALLWTAINAAPQCAKVFLAAANYLFTKPPQFLWDNPVACQNIGPALGVFGTTTLPAGYEVEGRGAGTTGLYLATNFPNGDLCNHMFGNLAPFQNGGACFAIALMGGWKDFRIDGGGQGAPTALSGKTLGPYMAVGKLVDYTCLNYGAYTGGNSAGIEMSFNNWLDRVNSAGCGSIGSMIDAGAANNVGHNVVIESSSVASLFVLGPGATANVPVYTCFWCDFAAADSQPLGSFPVIQNRGGNIKLIGGRTIPYNGNEGANTNNGINAYTCQTTAGCVLFAEATTFEGNTGGGSNTNGGITCTVTCTNILLNDFLGSQSSGFDISDVAGSVEVDLGGNTVTPRFSISGSQVGDASITGTTITAAKLVLSAGWGASAAWTALTGQTRTVQGTLTNTGAGQAANPTIVYTFPTPFWSATNLICSASQVGGTQGAILNTFTPSALTATGVTFTYNGTPTVGLTEIVQISCGVK